MGATKARRGEVIIDENSCSGCGYCVLACKSKCIEITGENVNSKGVSLPVIVKPEECNACGGCAVMCPPIAIEVYAIIEK